MNESATSASRSCYREWLPPPQWRVAVVCLWEQRVSGHAYQQRVLPDGCADIIVDGEGRAVVAGPARHVSLPEVAVGTVRGLRLRSEAIGAVLGVGASELADVTVPLDSVVPARRAHVAVDVLLAGREPAPWWADVTIDSRLAAACGDLRQGLGTVEEVACAVGLSSRQLRRLLLDSTGQGPKMLQRVGRLHRFLDLAERGEHPWPLAVLAASAGYADQAHLSREVRDLAGITAVELLRERSASV